MQRQPGKRRWLNWYHIVAFIFPWLSKPSYLRESCTLAAKLTRTLYTTEELKTVIKAADLKNADTTIPTIIACCLRYSGSKLKKSICNVVTYEKRDYNQMMVKRKKKNKTNQLILVPYMKWKKKQKMQTKKK